MPNEGVKDEMPSGFTLRHTFHSSSKINRIAWSPDGRTLASATRSEAIQLWDTNNGSIRNTLEGIFNFSIAWSPDGKILVSGSSSFLFFWDTETGKLLYKLRTPGKSNKSIAWSPDGKILAVASEDRIIRLWDLESRKVCLTLPGHTLDINSIAWSPDGKTLASGSDDETICLWNPKTEQPICTFTEHFGSVNNVAWSPDGQTIASASTDNTIRIWDFKNKRLSDTIEGHTGPVICIAFSFDGYLLASKSLDGTVRIWCNIPWEEKAIIRESSSNIWVRGLTFHSTNPMLATLGNEERAIRIWDLDMATLLEALPDIPSTHYTNAKVVMVGEHDVGKTSLGLVLTGQPFAPPESLQDHHVWLFDSQEVDLGNGRKETHETLLWDMAGQPNYHLTHKLYLDEVVLALIVFDSRSNADTFADINLWDRMLRSAQRIENNFASIMKRFLVDARIDLGRRRVSQNRVDRLMGELKLDKYFETSAKTGKGIAELKGAIKTAIDWELLPRVNSTKLFQNIKDFIIDLKGRGWALDSLDNLYRTFLIPRFAVAEHEDLHAQFETCIKLLSSQGLIKQLSFGKYVLLKPRLLDYYTSALIDAVNNEPDGLGNILEDRVLEGDFYIPGDDRLQDEGLEKLLLIAMVRQLLDFEIALRERTNHGSYLVFPSQSIHELPGPTDLGRKRIIFYFTGPALNIYTTLAVRLAHSDLFKKKEIGKGAMTFTYSYDFQKVPGTFGIFLPGIGEDRGECELTLSFDEHTSNEGRLLLEQFVHSHLQSHALEHSIRRQRVFILDEEEPFSDIHRLQASMESAANTRREHETNITNLRGLSQAKIIESKYEVFLCYNHEDKLSVKKIGQELMNRGIAPWLDMWDILPGRSWQDEIEQQIEQIQAAAVFVGKAGIGPWQMQEIRAWLREFVRRSCPVIPVLLENASDEPELPVFLRGIRWVDFRKLERERNPYSRPDIKLEQEKLLLEAHEQGERLLAEARKLRERLLVEAHEQGKLLLVEALNQGILLLVEAHEQGELLREVRKLGMRFQEAQEFSKLLQETPLEQGELLGEARKLRERLLAEAHDQGERLLTEALTQGERLLAEVHNQEEHLLVEAKELGERLLAEAHDQGERLLAETHDQGERLLAEAHDQGERFPIEDQAFDQDPSPMDLLISGITKKRIVI